MDEKNGGCSFGAAGIFVWIFVIIAVVFHIMHGAALAKGEDSAYIGFAIVFYILAGVCFWMWLIGKVFDAKDKATDAQTKTSEHIDKLEEQNKKIEELKEEKKE